MQVRPTSVSRRIPLTDGTPPVKSDTYQRLTSTYASTKIPRLMRLDAFSDRTAPLVPSNATPGPSLYGTALAITQALTRPWDAPLHFTSSWFHFIGEGLSAAGEALDTAPWVAAAVATTPVAFPLALFADTVNIISYPLKIAARYLIQDDAAIAVD